MTNKQKAKAYDRMLESSENIRKSTQKDDRSAQPRRGSNGVNNTISLMSSAKKK
jgi:dsDNA-binding SOS-regulon protein